MQVMKFGGSSVANATNISKVLDLVTDACTGGRVILVCSAIKGCTDALIAIGRMGRGADAEAAVRKLLDEHLAIVNRLFTGEERQSVKEEICSLFSEIEKFPQPIEAYGEILSTRIIARKLACDGVPAQWLDSRRMIITRDGKVDRELTYGNIASAVRSSDALVIVAPGFIAGTSEGGVTTLGRGGSDYSAALYAAGVQADSLVIWTDVPGIMTTNPRNVPAARTVPQMSYGAALCMAENGAKVLYAPTVAPAMDAGIVINIRDTFHPKDAGTAILDLPVQNVSRWIGIADHDEGESTRLCLCAEGPVDGGAAVTRIISSLKEAGIAPERTGVEDGYVWADVNPLVFRQACSALHKEFFEESEPGVTDIYVAGNGAVGKALVSLVEKGMPAKCGREIRVAAISSDHSFVVKVLEEAPRHSVFVDCTDSEDIYRYYVPLLEKGIDIVSANRRSLAVPYVEYAAMKTAALRSGCFFRYSTTVGTALPLLETLALGANSGDEIQAIDAVVSCTLNYLITSYEQADGEDFASMLEKACESGLTEPDPRLDLGGKDALRKLLILAREAGVPLEETDVHIMPLLDEDELDCPLGEFFGKLKKKSPEFIRRNHEIAARGLRQRFTASLKRRADGTFSAEIGMKLVDGSSPFYWISGTENIVCISSSFSPSLWIKGAGEGARLAASCIMKDILG